MGSNTRLGFVVAVEEELDEDESLFTSIDGPLKRELA